MHKFRDINLFHIGSVVDVDTIENLQGVSIVSINDSGVAVKGNLCGPYYVISGKSQARIAEPKEIVEVLDENGQPMAPKLPRKKNGVELKVTYPEGNFTIAQFAEFNHISYPQALPLIKENCVEDGFALRIEGARGKAAKLYKKI